MCEPVFGVISMFNRSWSRHAVVARVEDRVRAIDDDRPLRRAWLRPHRVGAGRQILAVDLDRRRDRERRAVVRAGAPHAIVGDDAAEQLSSARDGAVVLHRDRRRRHVLCDRSVLTEPDRRTLDQARHHKKEQHGDIMSPDSGADDVARRQPRLGCSVRRAAARAAARVCRGGDAHHGARDWRDGHALQRLRRCVVAPAAVAAG